MTYNIVFVDSESLATSDGQRSVREKAVGDNIFLANLPTSPKVFAFFYPGSDDTSKVEERLRTLGQKTGDNLFINFGTLTDPDYDQAVECFGIGPLPVIVVTAVAPLAATPTGKTVFVRLDGKSLIERPDVLVRTVEELFNLFLAGKLLQAVMVGSAQQGKAAVAAAAGRVSALIQPVTEWAKDIQGFTLEIAGFKIDVRKSGGN
jgi:hypothetical protein